MMRRCVVLAALVILVAGGVAFAQQQGRQEKFEITEHVPQQVIAPCGDATILSTPVDVVIKIIDFRDKDDVLIKEIVQVRWVKPGSFWLGQYSDVSERYEPVPGSRVATSVPGETEIDRFDFEAGMVYGSGSLLQVTVPGDGRIFSETGHIYADFAGSFLINRGHNDLIDQDLAALCDYLSAK